MASVLASSAVYWVSSPGRVKPKTMKLVYVVYFQWDDDVRFVLDQHAQLDLYGVSSLKQ
jgi:hypothetical protein